MRARPTRMVHSSSRSDSSSGLSARAFWTKARPPPVHSFDVMLGQELEGIEVLGKLRQQPSRGGFEIGRIVPAPIDLDQQLVGGQVVGGELEALFQAVDHVLSWLA